MSLAGSRFPLRTAALAALFALSAATGCSTLRDLPKEARVEGEATSSASATRSAEPTRSSASSPTAPPSMAATRPAGTPDPTAKWKGPLAIIYLTNITNLAPVARAVSSQSTPEVAVSALLEGPQGYDAGHGTYTSIPRQTALKGLSVSDGVATVDLSGRFDDGGGPQSHRLRVAQVVYTLTAFPEIDAVRVRVEGRDYEPPQSYGFTLPSPTKREDLEDVAPPVLIDSPAMGQTISGRVQVRGSAKVPSKVFEMCLYDSSGNAVAVRNLSSEGDERKPFSFYLEIPAKLSGEGEIEATYPSPGNGQNVVAARVKVMLSD